MTQKRAIGGTALAHRLLQFQEVPDPHAGSSQAVVRVARSGLCHTDLTVLRTRGPYDIAKCNRE